MKSNLATTCFSPWRCAALLVIVIACMSSGSAQTPTNPSTTPQPSPTPSLERKFLKNILLDQRAIWTSPLHLRADDANWLVPLGLSTAALIATDRRTAGALHNNRLRLNISRDVGYLGSAGGASSIAGAFYLIGRATHNARARETGVLGGEALIDGGIVALVIKHSTQRRRPRAKEPGDFFEGGLSFPSGHTIAAWSLATIVAHEYRGNRLVQVSAYGLAAAASMARFTGRNHFLSDVLFGSAIGYGIGRYVYRTHHDPALGSISQLSPHVPSKLLPLIIPRYERSARNYGVALVWSF
jgi:membrane-associated phospholipid phosphatase